MKNRIRTRASILSAVGRLLAREGFRNLGVNALAREAGVDKVLIYRYFGGMENVLKALAEEGDFWPSSEELLLAVRRSGHTTDGELAAALLIEFGRALRSRPVTQEIMRWEMLERNELTETLARHRELEGMKLMKLFKGIGGVDTTAVGSLLAAGQTYLALRSKTADVYNGLSLNDDHDWKRLEDTIRSLVGVVFGETSKQQKRPAKPGIRK